MFVVVKRTRSKSKFVVFDIDTGVVKSLYTSEFGAYGIKYNPAEGVTVLTTYDVVTLMNKRYGVKCYNVTYYDDTAVLTSYALWNRTAEKVIIPYGITDIGTNAFCRVVDSSIKEIVLPPTVKCIHRCAFANLTSLRKISLPDSVELINECAFLHCCNLRHLRLGGSVQSIEGEAFRDCQSLQTLYIPSSVVYIGVRAFSECSSLTRVRVAEGCQHIDYSAFDKCTVLREVSLPSTLKDFEFNENCGLQQLMAITNKGGAFAGCPKLQYVTMSCSVLAKWCKYCMEDKLIPKTVRVIAFTPATPCNYNNFTVTLSDDVPYGLTEIRVPAEVCVNVCNHSVKVVTTKR